jgi:hypothetical protein
MKAILSALVLVASCSTLAAAQNNPYPTGCNDFITETVTCSDVDPGQGSCHGTLYYVIDYSTGGWGPYFGEFQTLACTGGTNQCQGNNSPTCPTCPSVSGYVVEETNPECTDGGDGGDGGPGNGPYCNCDDPDCGDPECGLFRHAPKRGQPSGDNENLPIRMKAAQLERNIFAADHRIELTIAEPRSISAPPKP